MLFHVKSSFSLLKCFPPTAYATHAHTYTELNTPPHTIKRSGQPPPCFIKGALPQDDNTNISAIKHGEILKNNLKDHLYTFLLFSSTCCTQRITNTNSTFSVWFRDSHFLTLTFFFFLFKCFELSILGQCRQNEVRNI